MCTIGYLQDFNLIFKNRDKPGKIKEILIFEKNFIACRTESDLYYSWGLNRNGCAFVSAAINSSGWTDLIYKGKSSEAQEKYIKENDGLENPMHLVSKMLPDVRSVEEWVKEIERTSFPSLGYNIIVADRTGAYLIEIYGGDRRLRSLKGREAVTNHFQYLSHGPKKENDYPSTFRRFNYANEGVSKLTVKNEIFDLLNPSKGKKIKKIWRNGPFWTISSSVLDLENLMVHRSLNCSDDYQLHSF